MPLADVGDQCGGSIRLDPIDAVRLVWVAMAGAATGDERVDLTVEDRDIGRAEDGSHRVATRRQTPSQQNGATLFDVDDGGTRTAHKRSGRRRHLLAR